LHGRENGRPVQVGFDEAGPEPRRGLNGDH
jgi:hypothetical protein